MLKSLGHRVRIYTPYGELLPGMAYLVRRLLENTSNDSFLRQGFSGRGVGRNPACFAIPNTGGRARSMSAWSSVLSSYSSALRAHR